CTVRCAETPIFRSAHAPHLGCAENLGSPICGLPVDPRFRFLPTRQPVVTELWRGRPLADQPHFTPIANWRQHWRDVRFQGERYSWSKDVEWEKFLELPRRTGARFELALSGYEPGYRERVHTR